LLSVYPEEHLSGSRHCCLTDQRSVLEVTLVAGSDRHEAKVSSTSQDEHELQAVAPAMAKLPTAQLAHVEAPATEYVPGGHISHCRPVAE
jgi:hypothetical protein